MGLYNILHGTNPDSALILAFLEIPDKYPMPPRFRNISYRDGTITLCCRQGGGNRECVREWADHIEEYKAEGYDLKDTDTKYYSSYCYCSDCNYNPEVKSKEDCEKFCDGDSDYQRNNYKYKESPYHVSDDDDDGDSTYNYHTFEVSKHPDLEILEKILDLQNQPDIKKQMKPGTWARMAKEVASDYSAGREINPSLKKVIDFITEVGEEDET